MENVSQEIRSEISGWLVADQLPDALSIGARRAINKEVVTPTIADWERKRACANPNGVVRADLGDGVEVFANVTHSQTNGTIHAHVNFKTKALRVDGLNAFTLSAFLEGLEFGESITIKQADGCEPVTEPNVTIGMRLGGGYEIGIWDTDGNAVHYREHPMERECDAMAFARGANTVIKLYSHTTTRAAATNVAE